MEGKTAYWRKTFRVEAVRLNTENMLKIAEELGLEYSDEPNGFGHDNTTPVPHITSVRKGYGFVGDWIVVREGDYDFLTHELFMQRYQTHSEQLSRDEKYAQVFELVMKAMATQAKATYHQDTDGMDIVAIETAKKILGEL